jgi:hypothetical protein
MGFEYRLHVDPPLADLAAVCDSVFASSEWQRITTSYSDVPDGIGVQCGQGPDDPSWPQVADLHLENERQIFVTCHDNNGRMFLDTLIAHLQSNGHSVTIDEDV